ncbi:fused MFS/spermidine synthase [Undibacterium danionis]|uniref:Fused MFS/spermidine synthase n=1 Tax=Undibacterium danionis TaxID=1812100 RepID=A0ABV6IC40_9BURK
MACVLLLCFKLNDFCEMLYLKINHKYNGKIVKMYIDSISYDNKLARNVLFGVIAFLMLTASFGLNLWPFKVFFSPLIANDAQTIYEFLTGYVLSFAVMFWAANFSVRSQVILLLLCPVVAVITLILLPETWVFSFSQPNPTAITFFIFCMGVPAFVMLLIRICGGQLRGNDPIFESRLRAMVVLFLLIAMVPDAALQLSSTLHPGTFDLYAMQWDAIAHWGIAPRLTQFIDSIFMARGFVELSYNLTPTAFLAIALLHLRKRPEHVASATLVWVVLTSCAFLAFNFFPITGPKYVFGSAGYLFALQQPFEYILDLVLVNPAPRNGMPSMHFGWMLASSIIWWRSGTHWWSRAIIIIMTMLTACGTLLLGEHYVVDLIVAVPFVLAAIALCTTSVPWSTYERKYIVLVGFGTWLVWIIVLRNLVPWAKENAWFPWLMLSLTIAVVVAQSRWMARFYLLTKPRDVVTNVQSENSLQHSFLERRIGWLFFASGSAALIYQVLFAKKLALVFGSTSTATLTVLATFLGGMAIGSLIGGRYAQRVKLPLKTYALIEGGIAIYCVLTPFLFDAVQTLYIAIGTGLAPESPVLLTLRVLLGAGVLLVPTILMGITLPFLAEVINAPGQKLGSKVALLYFANTAGATLGALLTSYAIIPMLGVNSTTRIAALVNLLVALVAIDLAKKFPWHERQVTQFQVNNSSSLSKSAVICAILALGIGGVVSLGLEVVYVHMLSIVAGNSVYAFGLMLATFLLGLAIGGEVARRILKNEQINRLQTLFLSLLGLATSLGLGMWIWNEIPNYFASFAEQDATKSFVAREAIRAMVCGVAMFPPTVFIGASYVFAMDVVTQNSGHSGIKMLGIGAAFNTLGNIVGVLLFGFFLLPMLGGLGAAQILTAATLLLALMVVVIGGYRLAKMDFVVFGIAGLCAALSLQIKLDYNTLSSGANVYFIAQQWGNSVDHAESIDGGLTTVAVVPKSEAQKRSSAQKGEFKTLLTNGKFQGNNVWEGEMQAQFGFAFAPLMHQERRERALVIGYGTGVTSKVFHDAGFKHLDIAELSSDVVNMANKHFADVNGLVSRQDGVQMHVTDGRNLLLLAPPTHLYDVVSIETSSIWFAGAASLYNKEFYSLVKSKLAKDGILQQWVQLHHMHTVDLLTVIATLRSEFKFVSMYIIGGQGILIATNSDARKAPVAEAITFLKTIPSLEPIRLRFMTKIEELENLRVLTNENISKMLQQFGAGAGTLISTDDNLKLEYNTPKGNVLDTSASTKAIYKLVSRYSESPLFKQETQPEKK